MSEGFLSKTALSPVNSSPKVAIVIPVCDVAPYLEDCLDSVLRQTFSNFQIFAVDDKSSDSSPSILKKYIEEDDRVSALFLDQRKGVSNARNEALEQIETAAEFDYVAFVDSDDIVEPAYLENLVKKSVETSSDITVCGFFNFSDDAEGVENLVSYPNEEFEQEDFIEHVFARGRWTKSIGGGGMVWKVLFSAHAIKGCRFPSDVKIVEDEVFCVNAAIRSRKFAYVPLALYGHRSRGGSLTCDKNIAAERVKARLISLEMGKALSEYAQLIMASALADASVKAFQCSQQILENQLLPYKQLILKAAEKGLVRKRSASKFLLFCNFPTLSKVFVKSRNLLIVLRGIFFGKRKT